MPGSMTVALTHDLTTFLSIEMRAAEQAVREGSVLAAVEAVTGPLG